MILMQTQRSPLATWLLPLALLLSIGWPLSGTATEASAFFNASFGDLKEELATAKAQGKHGIFIFFELDECPFCHRMKTTVFNQPPIQQFYQQNFLNLSIDIEGDIEITDFTGAALTQKQFAAQHRVRATPVLAFFDLTGKLVFKHTGATKDAAEFLLMGRFVVEGAYTQMPFIPYKRQQPKTAQ